MTSVSTARVNPHDPRRKTSPSASGPRMNSRPGENAAAIGAGRVDLQRDAPQRGRAAVLGHRLHSGRCRSAALEEGHLVVVNAADQLREVRARRNAVMPVRPWGAVQSRDSSSTGGREDRFVQAPVNVIVYRASERTATSGSSAEGVSDVFWASDAPGKRGMATRATRSEKCAADGNSVRRHRGRPGAPVRGAARTPERRTWP